MGRASPQEHDPITVSEHPLDEATRLARLHALQILDTDPEELFDCLAAAASAACGASIGMINLLDRDRLWTKAASSVVSWRELPRQYAICAHVVDEAASIEIPDLHLDARSASNPIVIGEDGFRSYAGAPLRLSDGACIGALCVFDTVPRTLDVTQKRVLEHLAASAVQAIEARRRMLGALVEAEGAHLALDRLYNVAPAILQATDVDGRLVRVTDRWLAEFGRSREAVIGRPFSEFVAGAGREGATTFEGRYRVRHSDGKLLDIVASSMIESDRSSARAVCVTVLENVSAKLEAQAELDHSRDFLERTGALAGVGGWEVDLATRAVLWSDHTCRLHDRPAGYQPSMEEGLNYYEPASRLLIDRALQRAIEHAEPWDLELAMVTATGRPFWARVVGTAETMDGIAVRLGGAIQDITGRKRLERQLAESRQMLEITLQSIGDAVITTNTASEVGWMNPAAEHLTGWSSQQAQGVQLGIIMPVSDTTLCNPVERAVGRCLRGGPTETITDDATLHGINRDASAIQVSAAPIRDATSEVLGSVVVFRDVSEQRRQQQEMRKRATHDSLTGLLNRAGLASVLEDLLRHGNDDPQPLQNALLYIDLDRFKIVNDSCGHSIGDTLLKEISALLRSAIRPSDIVSRLGGDEFGLVLMDCSMDEAIEVADRIRAQVDAYRLFHKGCSYRVGTSIGLVPIDGRWTSLQSLLQAGDIACYAAKEAGRNCVHAWSHDDQSIGDHPGAAQWVARLESALEENRFELYAQRIETRDKGAAGLQCEILLRMRERDGTLLMPGAFITAAERFHMAPMLDRWVLRHIIDQLERLDSGRVGLFSVNVSGQSIGDKVFRTDVVSWIKQARCDVGALCLEITETSAIARFAEAKQFIDEIRALGVKVALDDFGAGASSLGYLKNLTVDFLKIDGQFVRNLPDDPLDVATVRCFRDIARSVNIATVAESVERPEQYETLAALGIEMMQGYLIHRPEPLDGLLRATATSVHAPDVLEAAG